ncbi:MAG TPA: serine/threonine-protein kinase [Kofleriaceae bacterium]|nr:serine/threonine-protein kinase [Kofleriaceae bacterium]
MPQAGPTRQPITGRRLGDFVVGEILGAGGQGEVYRADQPALDRQAVIKTLAARPDRGAGVDRFLREAKLASRLDHPYAAHVYAFGAEPDGLLWIAMELVRGVTLADWLDTQGPIPLERFVGLLERICEVVHTAHEQGILHRDLKPGNIMVVSRAGRLLPKLLDFGIAKAMGAAPVAEGRRPSVAPPIATAAAADAEAEAETMVPAETSRAISRSHSPSGELQLVAVSGHITAQGAALGSPSYMAPELWREAADADLRADIYALGALAYECLTGRAPFEAPNIALLAYAHAEMPVPPLGPEFPAALDEVMRRAMAKDAAQRYGDVLEFGREFARAAGIAADRAAGAAPPPPELIDGGLREVWIARGPAPLADVFPRLSAAEPEAARDGMRSLVAALARYLGVLALAFRARMTGEAVDSPRVAQLVQSLRRGNLGPEEWIALARELTAPFVDRPDIHPVPELIAFLHGGQGAAEVIDLLLESGDELAACRPRLERVLAACEFLLDYRLVVGRGDGAESWMGVRRFHRQVAVARRRPLRAGEVVVLDADGYPVIALSPAAQVAPPTPDRPEEMFLLAGGGTHGARLVSEPSGFERHDDAVWTWLAEQGLGEDPLLSTSAREARPPYRALVSLTAEDADLFFGREREIDSFVNRLRIQPLAAVVGASGAGKSSFVHAGVIPALGPAWQAVTFRPGAEPLAALAAAREKLAGCASAVLVVDQLEEMFTLCADERQRERFAAALVAAADPLRIIITLRDDFLVDAEQLPAFRGVITRGMQLLTTPHEEDLVRILEEPARRVGHAFEDPELPREMVREVARSSSGLALLSFAAAKLWEARDRKGRRLTRSAHAAIGGVAGALAQHADTVVREMSADERQDVRELFAQLFTAGGTRAVRRRAELVEVLGRGAAGEHVLDRLIEARLLVASEGHDGQRYVEVAHEALLHAWPQLAEWRREDAEGTRRREELQAAARHWRDRDRARAMLWRGDVLTEHALWRRGYAGRLTDLESEFLAESLRDAARARRIRRSLAAAAAVLVVAGSLLLLWANRRAEAQRQDAETQRRAAEASAAEAQARLVALRFEQARQAHLAGSSLEALAFLREVLAKTEPDVSTRYLLASALRALDSEVRSIEAGSGNVSAIRFTRGGAGLVIGGRDAPASVWDPTSGARLDRLDDLENALSVDVSEDGTLVAIGSSAGAAVWRADTGELVARVGLDLRSIWCVDLSADGRHLLATGFGGTARVWQLDSPDRFVEVRVPDGLIHACQLSRDARTILTASTQARTWDARSGRLLQVFGTPGQSTFARLSPDGRRVATFRPSEPAMELWDAASGRAIASLRGHAVGVFDLTFSRDGRLLASAGRDRTAKLWDARDGTLQVSLPHPAEVRAVAFDPAGGRLATSAGDRRVRIWQVTPGRLLASMEGHLDLADDIDFSPDGALLASGGRDGTARVWRSATIGLVRAIRPDEPLFAATLSGDGRRILTFSRTGRATVWEAASGLELARFGGGEQLIDPAEFLTALSARMVPALDRTGARAAIPTGRRVSLVDVDQKREIASLEHDARVMCARFSPDGRRLATGELDGRVRVWDLGGQPVARVVDDRKGRTTNIDFSPDGTRLAWGNTAGELHVFDLVRGAEVYTTRAYGHNLLAIAFTPDGERIATGGLSRPMKIWSARRPEVVATLEETESTVAIDVAPDGARLFAIHSAGQASVWDVRRSSLLDRIGLGGAQGYWLEVSPDGDRVLLTSGEAEVWDVRPYEGAARDLVERLDRSLPYALEGHKVRRAP